MLCDVDDIFVMTGNDVNILLRRAALVPRNPDFMVIKSTKTILLYNLCNLLPDITVTCTRQEKKGYSRLPAASGDGRGKFSTTGPPLSQAL